MHRGTPVAAGPVVAKQGIESVIDELVTLGKADDEPRVLVDASLWAEVEHSPRQMAAGTIPPPIGAYCEIERRGRETTDKLPCVSMEASGEIEILDLFDPEITLDEDI